MKHETKDDGGPAYPQKVVRGIGVDSHTTYHRKGMTLWDHYAGHALNGLMCQWLEWATCDHMSEEDESLVIGNIENGDYTRVTCKQMAETAGFAADAMIAEKGRREAK